MERFCYVMSAAVLVLIIGFFPGFKAGYAIGYMGIVSYPLAVWGVYLLTLLFAVLARPKSKALIWICYFAVGFLTYALATEVAAKDILSHNARGAIYMTRDFLIWSVPFFTMLLNVLFADRQDVFDAVINTFSVMAISAVWYMFILEKAMITAEAEMASAFGKAIISHIFSIILTYFIYKKLKKPPKQPINKKKRCGAEL